MKIFRQCVNDDADSAFVALGEPLDIFYRPAMSTCREAHEIGPFCRVGTRKIDSDRVKNIGACKIFRDMGPEYRGIGEEGDLECVGFQVHATFHEEWVEERFTEIVERDPIRSVGRDLLHRTLKEFKAHKLLGLGMFALGTEQAPSVAVSAGFNIDSFDGKFAAFVLRGWHNQAQFQQPMEIVVGGLVPHGVRRVGLRGFESGQQPRLTLCQKMLLVKQIIVGNQIV